MTLLLVSWRKEDQKRISLCSYYNYIPSCVWIQTICLFMCYQWWIYVKEPCGLISKGQVIHLCSKSYPFLSIRRYSYQNFPVSWIFIFLFSLDFSYQHKNVLLFSYPLKVYLLKDISFWLLTYLPFSLCNKVSLYSMEYFSTPYLQFLSSQFFFIFKPYHVKIETYIKERIV